MKLFVIIIILTILSFVFFGTYETFFLDFYEESKANEYSSKIILPISALIIFIFSIKIYSFHKYNKNNLITSLKDWCNFVFLFVVFAFIFNSILSGLIIFLNVNLGNQESITISGKVTNKTEGKANYEIEVFDDTLGLIILDTKGNISANYYIGDNFKKKLFKGQFGIIYGF